MKKLTPKEQCFVAEYLKSKNATQAAIKSGYSARSAYSQGSRLLKKAEVADALKTSLDRVTRNAEISLEQIIAELTVMGTSKFTDFATWDAEGNVTYTDSSKLGRKARAVQEISQTVITTKEGEIKTVKLKLADKRMSLMDIAKLKGFIVNKFEIKDPLEGLTDEQARDQATELIRLAGIHPK